MEKPEYITILISIINAEMIAEGRKGMKREEKMIEGRGISFEEVRVGRREYAYNSEEETYSLQAQKPNPDVTI